MAPKRQKQSADEVYRIVDNKEVIQTRFPDTSLLSQMGLRFVTQQMFEKAGLGRFLGKSADTFPNFTREFIKSLKIYHEEGSKKVVSIEWRHHNKKWSLNRDQIEHALGVTKAVVWDDDIDNETMTVWWSQGTGEVYDAKRTSDTGISFPPWRLIHKVVAMCFCNRAENSKISVAQLFLMFSFSAECALYVPDWATQFVTACLESRKAHYGDIAVGGMITLLALEAGCNPRDRPIPGSHLYDETWCIRNMWLKWHDGVCRYQFGRGYAIDFPREAPVEFGTWTDMYIPPDVIPEGQHLPIPAPAPASTSAPAPEQRHYDASASGSGTQSYSDEQLWRIQMAEQMSQLSQRMDGMIVTQQEIRQEQRDFRADMLLMREQMQQDQEFQRQQWALQQQRWEYARAHYYNSPSPPDQAD